MAHSLTTKFQLGLQSSKAGLGKDPLQESRKWLLARFSSQRLLEQGLSSLRAVGGRVPFHVSFIAYELTKWQLVSTQVNKWKGKTGQARWKLESLYNTISEAIHHHFLISQNTGQQMWSAASLPTTFVNSFIGIQLITFIYILSAVAFILLTGKIE